MHDLITVESFRSAEDEVHFFFRSGLLSTARGGLLCTLLRPQFPRTELRVTDFNARKAKTLCTICCTLVFSWLIGYGLPSSEHHAKEDRHFTTNYSSSSQQKVSQQARFAPQRATPSSNSCHCTATLKKSLMG